MSASKRTIKVTRHDRPWWDLPWTAWLYEDGYVRTCCVAMTRDGAIRALERRIRYLDKPQPKIIHSEKLPYG